MRAFRISALAASVMLLLWVSWTGAQDSGYQTSVYTATGGNALVIASNGTLTVKSGGALTCASGSTVSIDDLTVADELAVTDNLNVGDDLRVGESTVLVGGLTTNTTITAKGNITASTSTVAGSDLKATDDLDVDDDSTLGDDVRIGGVLTVIGGITSEAAITAKAGVTSTTGTVSAEQLTSTDDAQINDDLDVTGDLDVEGVCYLAYLPVWGATTAVDVPVSRSGSVIYNTTGTTSTWTLPAAAEGLHYTACIGGTTCALSVDVQAGDFIRGLTNAAGDKIQNSGVAGNSVTLVAIDGTSWIPTSVYGTWSDGN